MNPAERLWRGLGAHDWAAVRSQFHAHAVIEWPHTGAAMGVDDYVGAQRERTARGDPFTVERVVTEGRNVVVEGGFGAARCAGFYDLHDGLIASAVEYWIGEAA